MPHERYDADDPREWLNRAESSLAQAKSAEPGVYLEDLRPILEIARQEGVVIHEPASARRG